MTNDFSKKAVGILAPALFATHDEIREDRSVMCVLASTIATDVLNRMGFNRQFRLATGELMVGDYQLSGTREQIRLGEADVHCWVEADGEFIAPDSCLWPSYAKIAGHQLPEPWPRFLWIIRSCISPRLKLEIGDRDDVLSDALYRWGRQHPRYPAIMANAEQRLTHYQLPPVPPLPGPEPEVAALLQEIENGLNPIVFPPVPTRPLPEQATRQQICYCSRRAVEIFKPARLETYQLCAFRAITLSALATRVLGRKYSPVIGAGWAVFTGLDDIWLSFTSSPYAMRRGQFHAFVMSSDDGGAEVIDPSAEFYPQWAALEALAWDRPDIGDWFWVHSASARTLGIRVGAQDDELCASIVRDVLDGPEIELMIGAAFNLFESWRINSGQHNLNPPMACVPARP